VPELPQRRTLHHVPPEWVGSGATFFVTICCAPRGCNQLCEPAVAGRLLEAARFYHERGTWWLKVIVLMPDHLHALVALPADRALSVVVRRWKAYLHTECGIQWQSGFFDHRLRSDDSEEQKADYIRLNPVRAGLAVRPELWPYVWPPTPGEKAGPGGESG